MAGNPSLFGRRILLLVPHPDDEVVAASVAIGGAQAEGAEIFALYLTHGCIAREMMWPWRRKNYDLFISRRRAEAEKSLVFLGLKSAGWSPRPARHLWREMAEAYIEITTAASVHNIDQLWVPAYEGGNADHDAANALAACWLADAKKSRGENANKENAPPVSVLEFAEYNFSGGEKHSQEFWDANGREKIVTLTENERKKKRAALALYASERLNLNYVEAIRECYRPLAAYDYSRPPHPGTLWYARFQWVPFRHPGVDFTDPTHVSRAISEFINRIK